MNFKSTWFLLTAAVLLAGFLYSWETFMTDRADVSELVIAGLDPSGTDRVQVRLSGHPEMLAERTNGTWHLIKPLPAPARPESIDALLDALARLKPQGYLSPRELMDRPDAEAEFGFNTPKVSIMLFSGKTHRQVLIGAFTAPGDEMFLEVVGTPGIHLVSTNLLAVIPGKPGDWRDTGLLEWKTLEFDRLQVNTGSRTLELALNPTNRQWRLPRLQARADGQLIEELFGQLGRMQIEEFITDNPQADLEEYGLATPSLELVFRAGSNVAATLQFGGSPTHSGTNSVYGRRSGSPTIFTVAAEALAPWRAPATEFRDRHLLTLRTVPDSIEVHGVDQFTLRRETNQQWRVMPQDFAADTNFVNQVLASLAQMRVTEFVKDVVTQPDLPGFGLDPAVREYIVQSGGNNAAKVHLLFGTNREDSVYTKRGDESSVATVRVEDFNVLPAASWEMRDRRIWHFTEDDVARVLVEQEGRKRELIRTGTNAWSVAEGSVGFINTFAVEESVHRLGDLSAAFWTARGPVEAARYGFTTPARRITVTLKDGTTRVVELGSAAPSQFPYARVTLDGEPWVFEFPWATAQFINDYMSIPVREL